MDIPERPSDYPRKVPRILQQDLVCGREYLLCFDDFRSPVDPIRVRLVKTTRSASYADETIIVVQAIKPTQEARERLARMTANSISDHKMNLLTGGNYYADLGMLQHVDYVAQQEALNKEHAQEVSAWNSYVAILKEDARKVEKQLEAYNLAIQAGNDRYHDDIGRFLGFPGVDEEPIFHLTVSQMQQLLQVVSSGQIQLFEQDV